MTNYDTKLSVWYNNYVPERFPTISKPKIVGYFSVDGERSYTAGAKNLKYLHLQTDRTEKLHLDLNKGYDNVIHKPESATNERIDHLLEFILKNKAKFVDEQNYPERKGPILNCDFVSFRGLLRQIMCSPYERRDDWCILATRYRGSIYLCLKGTEQKQHEKAQETELSKKFCSYGFKFEQFMLSEDPNEEPNTDVPVNEAEEFSCVFQTKLEGIRLFYGAEMDGIKSNKICDIQSVDANSLEFIELKVKRRETNFNQKRNFIKFKLRNWWCQSFLVGISKIYVGLRNDNGIVNEIDVIDLKSIPPRAKEHWSPAVCLDFLVEFLKRCQYILQSVDCPFTVYEFYWDPKNSRSVTYKVHKDKNENSFLPDWYLKEIK